MRVPISKNARALFVDRFDGSSESAAAVWTAMQQAGLLRADGGLPASIEVDARADSPAADALATWAGLILEVASVGEGGAGPNNPCYAEGATASCLWLRLLAAGATDQVADASTVAAARAFAPLTWTALGNNGQAAIRKAVG